MDYVNYSFRKSLFKRLARNFIKQINTNIKEMDYLVFEYCLIALREEFYGSLYEHNVIKNINKFEKLKSAIKDLEIINNNLKEFKMSHDMQNAITPKLDKSSEISVSFEKNVDDTENFNFIVTLLFLVL